jgi:hypothetical protein
LERESMYSWIFPAFASSCTRESGPIQGEVREGI